MRCLNPVVLSLLLWASPSRALDLQALWDFGNPALSEQRFTAAMAGATADELQILRTQIARTLGLRQAFDQARRVLAEIEPALAGGSAELRVRHALELGRSYASARHPKDLQTTEQREIARGHFLRAHERAVQARLDALAVDALHMMVFVDVAPDRQLAWNHRALQLCLGSAQPDARAWEGSLRHNIGYALQLKGEYAAAREQYQLSGQAYDRDGRSPRARIARWMVARTHRLQGQLEAALGQQLALERENDAAGRPDPFVYEELELIYRARGDEAQAQQAAERRAALLAKPS
jgi:tetratricopeptide (TPR) repeat protein